MNMAQYRSIAEVLEVQNVQYRYWTNGNGRSRSIEIMDDPQQPEFDKLRDLEAYLRNRNSRS